MRACEQTPGGGGSAAKRKLKLKLKPRSKAWPFLLRCLDIRDRMLTEGSKLEAFTLACLATAPTSSSFCGTR
jgi:hypothetical protein